MEAKIGADWKEKSTKRKDILSVKEPREGGTGGWIHSLVE
jgi:hypothetical protein